MCRLKEAEVAEEVCLLPLLFPESRPATRPLGSLLTAVLLSVSCPYPMLANPDRNRVHDPTDPADSQEEAEDTVSRW